MGGSRSSSSSSGGRSSSSRNGRSGSGSSDLNNGPEAVGSSKISQVCSQAALPEAGVAARRATLYPTGQKFLTSWKPGWTYSMRPNDSTACRRLPNIRHKQCWVSIRDSQEMERAERHLMAAGSSPATPHRFAQLTRTKTCCLASAMPFVMMQAAVCGATRAATSWPVLLVMSQLNSHGTGKAACL